jgi:hypothetical protein
MNLGIFVIESGVEAEKDHRGGCDSNEWFGQHIKSNSIFLPCLRVVCVDCIVVALKRVGRSRWHSRPRVGELTHGCLRARCFYGFPPPPLPGIGDLSFRISSLSRLNEKAIFCLMIHNHGLKLTLIQYLRQYTLACPELGPIYQRAVSKWIVMIAIDASKAALIINKNPD